MPFVTVLIPSSNDCNVSRYTHGGQTEHDKIRIPGVNFNEVLYADDTICVSTDMRAMNILLAAIEVDGQSNGLRLNKTKCEVMHNAFRANIHFKDGTHKYIISDAPPEECYTT